MKLALALLLAAAPLAMGQDGKGCYNGVSANSPCPPSNAAPVQYGTLHIPLDVPPITMGQEKVTVPGPPLGGNVDIMWASPESCYIVTQYKMSINGDAERRVVLPVGCPVTASKPEKVVPFDVPPKEWDTGEKRCTAGVTTGNGSGACVAWSDTPDVIHHRTCTDKSRFLLMSEDGKWHCLDFSQRP